MFYQGPLLALVSRQGYLCTLGQRLPVAWVAANLGMAGINPLAVRLFRWLTSTCSMMELSICTVLSFWIAVLVGACLAMVLLLPYEGELTTPSWRKLWGWILLSFVVLIGGVILG